MKILTLMLLLGIAQANPLQEDVTGMQNYGEKMYKIYCVGCHGNDGKGNGYAANFVEDKSRLAKSDEELINSILNGKGIMPAYSWMMTKEEAQKLVTYIRGTYGQ